MNNSSFAPQRFIGIFVGAILILSIPLTLTLVFQQQDIRQRAEVGDSDQAYTETTSTIEIGGQPVDATQINTYDTSTGLMTSSSTYYSPSNNNVGSTDNSSDTFSYGGNENSNNEDTPSIHSDTGNTASIPDPYAVELPAPGYVNNGLQGTSGNSFITYDSNGNILGSGFDRPGGLAGMEPQYGTGPGNTNAGILSNSVNPNSQAYNQGGYGSNGSSGYFYELPDGKGNQQNDKLNQDSRDVISFSPVPGYVGPYPSKNGEIWVSPDKVSNQMSDGCQQGQCSVLSNGKVVKLEELARLVNKTDTASVSATVYLPGIGKNVGDTTVPLHASRAATLFVFDPQNQLIATGTGILTFNSTVFTGIVNLQGDIATSPSTFKLAMNNTLIRALPGTFTASSNATLVLPSITLISGDLNQNNDLDLTDYNNLRDCIKGLPTCTDTIAAFADMNDDGKVEEVDMNILLRAFANKSNIQ